VKVNKNRLWTWVLTASLAAGSSHAVAANSAELAKRLHNAADMSSLDDPALKPWHLKLDVQLYDDKGQPSEKGTIEEWWTPEKDKRIYDTPSYKATEVMDSKSVYRTKGQPTVPFLLNEARNFVVHPVATDEVIDKSDLEQQTLSFGKVKLDCVMLYKKGKRAIDVPPGGVSTFCLESGTDQLRVSWLDPEVSTRHGIGLFQGRRVGVDDSISIYGVKVVSGHVEILDSETFDSSVFAVDSDLEDRPDDPVWVSAGRANAKKLGGVPPKYPMSAKDGHVSGAVMLIATIGTDGHVIRTDIVGNPDRSLAESAVESVKQWVYAPYIVNGAAVKIKTVITIHYNFGRV